jgi:hypothetical protein
VVQIQVESLAISLKANPKGEVTAKTGTGGGRREEGEGRERGGEKKMEPGGRRKREK